MSNFTDPLILKKLRGKYWETSKTLTYYVGEENSETYVTVPVGFKTDLASVPRFFWSIIPPDGDYSAAAVLHDYLYFSHTIIHNNKEEIISRKYADDIFFEAMGVLGVGYWLRRFMYYKVRFWGMFVWDNKNRHGNLD